MAQKFSLIKAVEQHFAAAVLDSSASARGKSEKHFCSSDFEERSIFSRKLSQSRKKHERIFISTWNCLLLFDFLAAIYKIFHPFCLSVGPESLTISRYFTSSWIASFTIFTQQNFNFTKLDDPLFRQDYCLSSNRDSIESKLQLKGNGNFLDSSWVSKRT